MRWIHSRADRVATNHYFQKYESNHSAADDFVLGKKLASSLLASVRYPRKDKAHTAYTRAAIIMWEMTWETREFMGFHLKISVQINVISTMSSTFPRRLRTGTTVGAPRPGAY